MFRVKKSVQQDFLLHSHESHALNPSPWPILMSVSLFQLVALLASIMNNFSPSIDYINMLLKMRLFDVLYSFEYIRQNNQDGIILYERLKPIYLALILSIVVFSFWLRDVVREGTFTDHHTALVKKSLRMGMLLFIVSEMFFF